MATRVALVVFNLCSWRCIWFLLFLLKVDVWRWFLKFPSPQNAFESWSEACGPDVKTFGYAWPAVVCQLCLVSLSSIWLDDFNIRHVQRSDRSWFFCPRKGFRVCTPAHISHFSSLWPRSRTNTSLFPGGPSFLERFTLSTSGGSDTRLVVPANLLCHLQFGNFSLIWLISFLEVWLHFVAGGLWLQVSLFHCEITVSINGLKYLQLRKSTTKSFCYAAHSWEHSSLRITVFNSPGHRVPTHACKHFFDTRAVTHNQAIAQWIIPNQPCLFTLASLALGALCQGKLRQPPQKVWGVFLPF